VSLAFFVDLILPAALRLWRRISLWKKDLLEGAGDRYVTLTFAECLRNSGRLNLRSCPWL